jgi:hypothetical protein
MSSCFFFDRDGGADQVRPEVHVQPQHLPQPERSRRGVAGCPRQVRFHEPEPHQAGEPG